MPCRSVLLSKNKVTAVLCHCSYTLKVLLFLQGCDRKPKMHCSRIHIKIRALLLSVAEQNQADSSLVLLQLHPKGFALLTRVQSQT